MRFAAACRLVVSALVLSFGLRASAQAPANQAPAQPKQFACQTPKAPGTTLAPANCDPTQPTLAFQKICDAHGLPIGTCRILTEEINHQHLQTLKDEIAKGTVTAAAGAVPSDKIWGDPSNVTTALLDRASVMVLQSDLTATAEPLAEAALQQILNGANFKQVGAQASDGGSTSLVTKPTTTDLISLASESGAFTDTTNGTSMTVQTNALGLSKLLSNTPIYKRVNSTAADFIQPLNFSIVLNIAQASNGNTVVAGAANKTTPSAIGSIFVPSNNATFSSFTASYNLYRHYNPQSTAFLSDWNTALAANKASLTSLGQTIAKDLAVFIDNGYTVTPPAQMVSTRASFHTDGAAAEAQGAAGFEALVVAYMPYWEATLQQIMPDSKAAKNILTLSNDLLAYRQATYAVLNQARGTLATVSYTYTDDGQKPATHDFTGSVGYVFKGKLDTTTGKGSFSSGLQITSNVTASVYDSLPSGANYGRLRAFQGSAEIDKPFGGTSDNPKAVVSFAGYGQYQFDPTVLNITAGNLAPGTAITLPSNAQVLLGTSGWLGVIQGKLVINLAKGLSLPVAVKWSNKTDLVQADDVRGQFGLSYDLSALRSVLGIGNK